MPTIREQIEDKLRQMFGEVGVKLTEIGWEVAEENIQDTATKLESLISQSVIEARQEAIDYFYWRIDCSTLISELEGWRGCIDNAKDQTERHYKTLANKGGES